MRKPIPVTSLLTGMLLATSAAGAEQTFSHDYLELGYSRQNPDRQTVHEGTSIAGLQTRISLSIADDAWIAVEHANLSSENLDGEPRRGLEYSALLFGGGQQITNRGMAYVEAGPSFSRLSNADTQRSVVFGVGIRTQISPRFELGGGPRLGGNNRLDPEEPEWSMRVHGLLDLSERVAVSGSYDYRDNASQWRLGARVSW